MSAAINSGTPARAIYLVFALAFLASGIWLLADPAGWNDALHMQAEDLGDGNLPLHLLRNMGVTHLCASIAFLWCLLDAAKRRPIHVALLFFFLFAAGLYAVEILSSHMPAHRWVTDFPLVFLPPLVLASMLVPLPSFTRRETGRVKWFDAKKGFGFIVRGNGEEIFVHYREIRGNGRRVLKDGQAVRFRVVAGEKGQQAGDVTPLEPDN